MKIPKSKKFFLAVAGIALVSLGVVISLVNAEEETVIKQEEARLPLVETKELKPTDIQEVLNTIGFFVPENDWRVTPDTIGTVEKVLVSEGDIVSQGDLLFQLDNSTQKDRVNEAQRDLNDARNNLHEAQQEESWSLKTAQDNLEEAQEYEQEKKEELEEARKDYEEGEITKLQLERYEDRYEIAQRRTERAEEVVDSVKEDDSGNVQEAFYEEQVKWAERLLERAEDEYEKTYVQSPASGEVLKIRISEGDTANPVNPAIVIVSEGRVHISTSVSEQYIVNLSEGESADVVIPAISNEKVTATITEVGIVPEEGGRFYPVNLVLDDEVDNLRVGMNAQLELPIVSKLDVLAVPRHAIIEEDEEEYVYVIDEENIAKLKPVTSGISQNGLVHVEGLEEGDNVVVAGLSQVDDGVEVEVVREDK
ncbi:efflux RND transporter periplasmic adaptor subunit [Proteinivorax tanatarense]|uniref:Efflux RND transporter periplasmic adaptor subunit n=1 Tax=Proteinivorax tanatarense TaxID=1260629 RepID=A0AAU7VIN5_9FIRM